MWRMNDARATTREAAEMLGSPIADTPRLLRAAQTRYERVGSAILWSRADVETLAQILRARRGDVCGDATSGRRIR